MAVAVDAARTRAGIQSHAGRARIVLVLLGLALAIVALISLHLGRYPIPVTTTIRILWSLMLGRAHGGGAWTDTELVVIQTVRLPRVLAASIAGAGLGLSGAALQGLFRNPLVGPQVVGISHGAALGGVIAILIGANSGGVVGLAFALAFAALVAVFMLSRASGASILSIVLAGVIVSAFFAALVGVTEIFADPERQLPSIVYWLLGSLATASWRSVAILAPTTMVAGCVLLMLRWRINILSLGETDAAALGVRVAPLRWFVLVLVTFIVAAQVSVSGTIGWVGLVAPHLTRRLVGPNHQYVLPASTLLGAVYLLIVDDVARSIAPQEIPIGVLTALIGAPVFAVVFWKAQARGWARE
jgi:iron complex transport system permease protein